jgi:hypothetical protein
MIFEHFQAISNYDLQEAPYVEDDGIEEWHCTPRAKSNHLPYIVTINRVDGPELSNIMVCTCDMPSNYLLPCSHVMAVNQHIFHQPVILAQVGDRWRRNWQPSSFRPRQEPAQFSEDDAKDAIIDGVAVEMEFAHPEDEVERNTVSWEMSCDEVLAHVDEALEHSRDRPAMMDICRAFAREMRDVLLKRLVGDYTRGGPLSRRVLGDIQQNDDSNADVSRLQNPQITSSNKRQRRFLSKGENVLGRSAAAGLLTQ